MEGDKAGGGEGVNSRGDEVAVGDSPRRGSSQVLLNVQFKVKSSNQAIQQQQVIRPPTSADHGEPINVTLEYSPDDLEVSISAQLVNGNEMTFLGPLPSAAERSAAALDLFSRGGEGGKKVKLMSVGTDANQRFDIHMDSEDWNSEEKPKTRPSKQNNFGQQFDKFIDGPEMNNGENEFPRQEDFEEDEVTGARSRSRVEGDESLYQTVLMGNDSFFGDISMINNAPSIENVDIETGETVSSVDAIAGSCVGEVDEEVIDVEVGYDVTDRQLYPGFEDTDEIMENKILFKDKEEEEMTATNPLSKEDENEECAPEYKDNFGQDFEDGQEVREIIRDFLEQVDSCSEEEEELELPEPAEVGEKMTKSHKGRRTTIKLTTTLPIKSRKYVSTGPLVLKLKANNHFENEANLFEDFGQKKTRGGIATIFKNADPIAETESETVHKKLSWVTEPCHHGKTPHACHVCIPIPEEAVALLENTVGLNATEARKAAFTFLRYMRDNQNTSRVKLLMKYATGLDVVKKRSSKRQQISYPVAHNTKEQKLRAAIQSVARQRGCWGIFEDEEVVSSHLKDLKKYLRAVDEKTVKRVLREDRYQSVKALGMYFALEKRWILRAEILAAFDLLISKDYKAFEVLLMSEDVPVDLVKAIKQEYLKMKRVTKM